MGRATVLDTAVIVEPSQYLRELVAILLEETGYEVKELSSLDEVVPFMEAGARVALLFADMPARQLVRTARTLSENWPSVRIIVPCESDERSDFLPRTALRMNSPWNALDVLIHAERARQSLAM